MFASEDKQAIPAWLICDSAFIRKFDIGNIYPGTTDLKPFAKTGYLISAATPDQHAKAVGVAAAGLLESILCNHESAKTGLRPEEPPVGKTCVRQCRSGLLRIHYQTKY